MLRDVGRTRTRPGFKETTGYFLELQTERFKKKKLLVVLVTAAGVAGEPGRMLGSCGQQMRRLSPDGRTVAFSRAVAAIPAHVV